MTDKFSRCRFKSKSKSNFNIDSICRSMIEGIVFCVGKQVKINFEIKAICLVALMEVKREGGEKKGERRRGREEGGERGGGREEEGEEKDTYAGRKGCLGCLGCSKRILL